MSNITPKSYFSKVAIARQLLREKAEVLLTEYMDVVMKAKEAGDYETAAKALQWLIDHMPSEAEDGGRLVEQSVDKKQEVKQQGPTGPAIQIGISVGGVNQKALPIAKPDDIVVTTVESE
jgi:hypothetical protein